MLMWECSESYWYPPPTDFHVFIENSLHINHRRLFSYLELVAPYPNPSRSYKTTRLPSMHCPHACEQHLLGQGLLFYSQARSQLCTFTCAYIRIRNRVKWNCLHPRLVLQNLATLTRERWLLAGQPVHGCILVVMKQRSIALSAAYTLMLFLSLSYAKLD